MDEYPKLVLSAPGATSEQIERGLKAALALFEERETTPEEVDAALCNLQTDEISGVFTLEGEAPEEGEPDQATTTRQWDLIDVWQKAEHAAEEACFGSHEEGRRVDLVLLYDPPASQH